MPKLNKSIPIKFNFPMGWQPLIHLKLTKGELLSHMGLTNENGIDTALPQDWLNAFVAESPFEYQQVLSTTFWIYYNGCSCGQPISACSEIDKVLMSYGWQGYDKVMTMLQKEAA